MQARWKKNVTIDCHELFLKFGLQENVTIEKWQLEAPFFPFMLNLLLWLLRLALFTVIQRCSFSK